METTFDYLRQFGPVLAERILETYPPLQSTKDPVAPGLAGLLRKPLPAQAVAITGTAKYLRKAKAARIVAECGAGKTLMSLGTIHVLSEGQPTTTLVMCPSHITHKWAREVLLTTPRARTFLIEDMRNGGDPAKPHGVREVKLSKGKTVYEGKHLSLAEMRRLGRKEWRKRFTGPTFFITGKDKGKLSYFWDHVYVKAKSGPNLGGIVNPDSGEAILDSEMEKLTTLDFRDKQKVAETLVSPRNGTTRFSALWQADRNRIQRMAPIEYIGRYMAGWFDFAIADELHQLAGDTAQGNGLGVLGRAAQRLIALTGTLMGGYADDLFNIFYRMEPRAMVREGFAYGGQGRRDFQEQYGALETVEKIEGSDNACSRATKKTVRVLRKPGASPLLFGKFLMNTTAFLALEDISDNLPRYDEIVISVDMDEALQQAYGRLEEDIRSAMKEHRGNKSLMSILLNTLLLYPDHPYDFDEIWARAFDPQTKEYVKFLVTVPETLAGTLAHEVMHPALHHHVRRSGRDPKRWNMACDFAINPLLVDAGLNLPEGVLLDNRFRGMSAEQIYNLLESEAPQDSGSEDEESESGGEGTNADQLLAGEANEPSAPMTDGGIGQVLDAPEPDKEVPTIDEQVREWDIAVNQATTIAKHASKVPAGLNRTLEGAAEAAVDWREVLRRFWSETAPADYSWMRPNRRHLWTGLYLPGVVREGVGEVAIAVDCSGSVSARQLRLFEAEVRSILEGQRPERVYVLYFDAVVHKVETYEAGERIDLNPVGGGGTEFGPCFGWLDDQGIRPQTLVFLTDLYGSFPPSSPSYPVLWASTGSQKAPFGQVIPMQAA